MYRNNFSLVSILIAILTAGFAIQCGKDVPFQTFYGKWKNNWPIFEKELKETKDFKNAGKLADMTLAKMKATFENLQIDVREDHIIGLGQPAQEEPELAEPANKKKLGPDQKKGAPKSKKAARKYKQVTKIPKDVTLKKNEYLIQYDDKISDLNVDPTDLEPERVILHFDSENRMRMGLLGDANAVIFWLIFDRI